MSDGSEQSRADASHVGGELDTAVGGEQTACFAVVGRESAPLTCALRFTILLVYCGAAVHHSPRLRRGLISRCHSPLV